MEKIINHPFEDLFDIEPGTTVVESKPPVIGSLVDYDMYDEKDREIEGQYEMVFNSAFDSYQTTMLNIERGSDPGNSHKNLEAANQFLSTALNAAKEKADLKFKKDKGKGSTNITNNNLIMDRDSLLAMIQNK
jgi:hypothetical protein